MSITIEFLGPINKKPMQLEIGNLNQLSEILKADENLP